MNYGLELEAPLCGTDDDPLCAKGKAGDDITDALTDKLPDGTEATYERIGKSEYGTEIRTPDGGLLRSQVVEWYEAVLRAIKAVDGVSFTPVGAFGNTTAGLHVHFSGIDGDDEAIARQLVEDSQMPELKAAFCSTVYYDDEQERVVAPICRADAEGEIASTDYCEPRYGSFKHCVVNPREAGHYEWRLPEPMRPENLKVLVGFLDDYLRGNRESALAGIDYIINEQPQSLTSAKRAKRLYENGHTMPRAYERQGIVAEAALQIDDWQ